MNGWSVGNEVTWYDGAGNGHTVHIIAVHVFAPGSSGNLVSGSTHFQVCTTNTGSSPVKVFDAV